MRKYLIILSIGLLAMACSKSPYQQLEDQFAEIKSIPHEFKFAVDGVADPVENTFIDGTVRPVGKVSLKDGAVMLVANNWDGEQPEWGDLTGYIFKGEKLIQSITLATDFSQRYKYSVLKEDFQLTIYDSVLDPDSGEEQETEEVINLNDLIK